MALGIFCGLVCHRGNCCFYVDFFQEEEMALKCLSSAFMNTDKN